MQSVWCAGAGERKFLQMMIAGFFLPFLEDAHGGSIKLSGLLMDGSTEVILSLILFFGSALVESALAKSDSLRALGVAIVVICLLVCLYLIATLPDKVVPEVAGILFGFSKAYGYYAELIGIILYIIGEVYVNSKTDSLKGQQKG